MDEEIEDIVGDVTYTDSQKSIVTEMCSYSWTDTNSDMNNSSGRATYIVDIDDSYDTESDESCYEIVKKKSKDVETKQGNATIQYVAHAINHATGLNACTFISQETFTQTSKTIIELAEDDGFTRTSNLKTLETQTSSLCITENQTIEYIVQYHGTARCNTDATFMRKVSNLNVDQSNSLMYYEGRATKLNSSLDETSSKFPQTDSDNDKAEELSEIGSNEEVLRIIEGDDSKDDLLNQESNPLEASKSDTDFEEDSLIEYTRTNKTHDSLNDSISETSEVAKSIDNDVAELYDKLLTESGDLKVTERTDSEDPRKRFDVLTPLTEESGKRDSIVDITPSVPITNEKNEVLFTNGRMTFKMLSEEKKEPFKLPPINKNMSCPNSPNLSMLFSSHLPHKALNKSETLPCVFRPKLDRIEWEVEGLAAGESNDIETHYENTKPQNVFQLPPISLEGHKNSNEVTAAKGPYSQRSVTSKPESVASDAIPISVRKRIKELKVTGNNRFRKRSPSQSSCGSPTTRSDVDRTDAADRACEGLCQDILKRLKSNSWYEVADTLDETPAMMSKFWSVITEQRIADLIRQVSAHIDSPRTQVARSACNTLSEIFKNTNYTKKPDFNEAVTILLIKTSSFSRPVRRAANMALDAIVCSVDLTQAVTAVCVHGVDHKSALVRTAASRLLVVCAALAGGGRGLLRSRPAAAATARKHALHSLSVLLEDKNIEARKYAERLYMMLRPLANFEAFYLTDVSIEVASQQMKKFDQLLLARDRKER